MRDISASVLAISTPTVPPPTSAKVSWRQNLLGFRMFDRSHFLGSLERTQDFSSNDVGIIERFEAGSELPPFVVSKVVVLDAGGEDEVVVRHITSSQMNEALA